MAKLRTSLKKKNGIVNLKIVVEKLQKSLSRSKRSTSNADECEDSNYVPKDVKEGHFAVIAVEDDEFKRFVVPLNYLTHPLFLKLLEQAAEEYGFDHEGALMIPCRPTVLERMLAEEWIVVVEQEERASRIDSSWGSVKTLIRSR